jgi:hypothetical protein
MSLQLLEALTDGTATAAVTKRNNPTILPIIPPMIRLFFSLSISDGIHYALSHTSFVFPSTDKLGQ